MKKLFKTAAALLLAGCCLAGCGDNQPSVKETSESDEPKNMFGSFDDSYNVDISEEDMPYGSNVGELTNEYDEHITIKICYDVRYFDTKDGKDFSELHNLHDYIVALNTQDAELMESLYYPGYLKYICEKNGLSGIDEYMANLHEKIAQYLGEDAEFNYIYVSNCMSEGEEQADAYFNNTADVISGFDASLAGRISSRKLDEIGGYTCFKTSSGVFAMEDYMSPFVLAQYEIDGKYYLF